MTYNEDHRPDPEELLRWVQVKEKKESRGRLKVFLGYASGVGKSFRMLDEGRRRRERGQDVVVGALQEKGQEEAERLLCGMEVIPPREELDVAAIIERHPLICLVDELAHDNPPGSRHLKRWQDVEELLESGISIITAVNIQHIQELCETLRPFVVKLPCETVPEAFLHTADEIVLVDASPEMLSERKHKAEGKLNSGREADNSHWVEQNHLLELREIALLLAAEIVDEQLEDYIRERGLKRTLNPQERILVCVTPRSNAEEMIEIGRKVVDRLHGELHVVTVVNDPEWSGYSAKDRAGVEGHLALARSLRAQVEALVGADSVSILVEYARRHRITQVFVGHSLQPWWKRLLTPNFLNRVIQSADGMDVRIFPQRAAT